MQSFHAVGGAQQAPKRNWKSEDHETFGDVVCHPLGKTRGALLVFRNDFRQVRLCGDSVGSIEDHANVCCDFCLHLLAWHVALRILLEMELAPLPGNATEDCDSSCTQSCMVITGNELHTAQPALLQAFKKGSPVDLMLTQ